MSEAINRRILVIDDQESIHDDFRKILGGGGRSGAGLDEARSAFFGETSTARMGEIDFQVVTTDQGEQGIETQASALRQGAPFALAFVDVRMPPGLDGLQTIKRLWRDDPDLQVVICTAYSDYSFEQIVAELGHSDSLLILKKPFDPVEVRQLAGALTEKWNATRRTREQLQQLMVANERAEGANRAKSEFLANMSHEIRTPMNALLGYVDLLCDPDVTAEEKSKYLQIVRKSGEHLLTILNDILDISRIEASRMLVHRSDFAPFDVAREVASLLLTQAAAKDLDLRLEVATPIPSVIESDHVRVRQILLNLLGNAIKFTQSGSVRLVVALDDLQRSSHRYIRFEVIDTGVGISAEQRETIFDAFSQVDTSSTREAGGTGLGLTICKRLALLLGGDIELESEPGRGSAFTLRLHAGEIRQAGLVTYSPEECALESPRRETQPEEPLTELRGNFLLVEDVKFNQVLVSAVLRKAGAKVTVAENGRACIQKVREALETMHPYDLVLMDMQMPVMDGYEATRRLRAAGFAKPILALTAHAMSDDRERCLEAGCTDYITKPLDRRELLRICGRLSRLERPRAPLPRPTSSRSPRE